MATALCRCTAYSAKYFHALGTSMVQSGAKRQRCQRQAYRLLWHCALESHGARRLLTGCCGRGNASDRFWLVRSCASSGLNAASQDNADVQVCPCPRSSGLASGELLPQDSHVGPNFALFITVLIAPVPLGIDSSKQTVSAGKYHCENCSRPSPKQCSFAYRSRHAGYTPQSRSQQLQGRESATRGAS